SGEASSVPGWGDTATELACASARSAVGVRPFVAALEDPLSPQAHSPAHIASAAISTLARIVVKPSARIIESPANRRRTTGQNGREAPSTRRSAPSAWSLNVLSPRGTEIAVSKPDLAALATAPSLAALGPASTRQDTT